MIVPLHFCFCHIQSICLDYHFLTQMTTKLQMSTKHQRSSAFDGCRWRRRWQWGPGPSHPQATTSALDTATAPVDIEQPAVHSHEAVQNDAGASSSSSHGGRAGNLPAAALGSTHFNFPGMHYSRSSASRLSAMVCNRCSNLHIVCLRSQNVHVLHLLLDILSSRRM